MEIHGNSLPVFIKEDADLMPVCEEIDIKSDFEYNVPESETKTEPCFYDSGIKEEEEQENVDVPADVVHLEDEATTEVGFASGKTGKKLLKCLNCDYTSTSRSNIKCHYLRHLKERPLKCDECSYSTVATRELVKHIAIKHKQQMQIPTSYRCSECCYTTPWKTSLNNHMANKHPKAADHPLKCDYCDFSTYLKQSFKRHMRSHMKEFKCEICQYQTAKRKHFLKHMERHADESKLQEYMRTCMNGDNAKCYRCDQCDFTSNKITVLATHMKAHSNDLYGPTVGNYF